MAREVITKQVKSIYFTLVSPEEVKKLSRAKIVTPELYDMDGYPVDGGLMDLRLGAIDPGVRCRTCAGKLKECLGHFGYIETARPVVHIKYISTIEMFLKATCEECGKLLLHREDALKMRLKERIAKARITKKCPHCNSKQGKVKFEKPYSFYIDGKRVFPSAIRSMLSRVSNEDAALLGATNCRPENAILTLILVPPVTVRPSITLETGERSEDDLTHKLSDIVRSNQRLWENLNAGAPEVIIEDLWDLLQYHVATFFDNTISQVPPARHRSGQPLKTLTERIKGKEGRIRHNLAGKRVDFSSRTVVSSDPYLKIDEVGIPLVIATTLTVPEKVTSANIEYLKQYIQNGKQHPGANYIVRPDGRKKKITDDLKDELINELEVGYVVERHLRDGDVLLFNRHPSLHRMSLMAHYAKILPGKTFRLNPIATFPYNADFDGDEMNIHAPQTEEARSEAIQLLDIKNHLVTPKDGTNVLGCIEDSISGNFILTSGMQISKDEAIQLIAETGAEVPKEAKRWPSVVDGKAIFSALLPKIDLKIKRLTIEDGKIIKGVVDDESIGIEKGKLILELMKTFPKEEVILILERIFRLGCAVLSRKGFTVGLDDVVVKLSGETQELIKDAYKKVGEIINDFHDGKLKALPGKTLSETREIEIQQALDGIRKKIAGIILEKINREEERNNPVNIMIFSGARGSPVNRVQMGSLVGQQILWGKRIELGYKRRTLSHFMQGELMPASRGFVANNFYTGLSPYEFFFSAITGRDSLMDTALRTPKSGYLYRRLANSLQDVKVEYDGTIRDGASNIVQFIYGDDGIAIERAHLKEKISPGEAIGIITAQSFGEPSTQMSLHKNEKVIVKFKDRVRVIEIGKFVDNLMQLKGSFRISDSEVLPLNDIEVYVPSLNSEEKMEWKRAVECSRHITHKKLVKLTTASGREIVATDNHSFVTRSGNRVVPVKGSALRVGDRIPVVNNLKPANTLAEINLYENISKKQSIVVTNNGLLMKPGTVTKVVRNNLKLDSLTGWFIGAYLAEGSSNYGQVSISNIDDGYCDNAKEFIESMDLDYKEDVHHRGFADSRDIKVSSTIFADFINTSCGNSSFAKKIPDFAYNTSDDFVSGLLRGYFDGDGNFHVDRKMIRASSNSKELLDGIALLLSRFRIFSYKIRDKKGQHWLLIPYKYAPLFLLKVGSDIEHKRGALEKLAEEAKKFSDTPRDYTDAISGFGNLFYNAAKKLGFRTRYVNNFTKRQRVGRTALYKYMKIFENLAKEKNIDISEELEIMRRMFYSDVVWDKIEKIEYVDTANSSSGEYVYDLSVPGLETFTTAEGIITHNTLNVFHFAGVAEFAITLGLPRLIELFDARKEPTTPVMEVYLKPEHNNEVDAERIASKIKEVTLKELASEIQINFTEMKIDIKLDAKAMKQHKLSSEDVAEHFKDNELSVRVIKDGLSVKPKGKADYKDLYKVKSKLNDIIVSGVKGIKEVLPLKRGGERDYVILTYGSNLGEILKIKEIDGKKTRTNNIYEVANNLGIEAARQLIIDETKSVIEKQGISIDEKHIKLIADLMTASGDVLGVTRTGIIKEKGSLLAKAAFETPIKHFVAATLNGEKDILSSVIENVIINQPVPVGTGLPGLFVKVGGKLA